MALQLEIISAEKSLFKGEVAMVVLPAPAGELGVEEGHCHMLASVRIGELRILGEGGRLEKRFAVNEGFAQITPSKTVVVVASGEPAEEIDVARAQAGLKRAEERLAKKDEIDLARAQAALKRAKNRLAVAARLRGSQ